MFMFPTLISTAMAAGDVTPAAPMTENSLLMNIAPILIIFVIFYFLVIRPQSKKIKAHQEMMGQLKKGDAVVTGGGFLGTVISVSDDHITVDLGKGVEVRALKHTLSGLQQPAVKQDNAPKAKITAKK